MHNSDITVSVILTAFIFMQTHQALWVTSGTSVTAPRALDNIHGISFRNPALTMSVLLFMIQLEHTVHGAIRLLSPVLRHVMPSLYITKLAIAPTAFISGHRQPMLLATTGR